jgi:N4-gp56 family major capsid protein
MTQVYNDPAGGTPSTIGEQIRTDFYDRKALYETRKERYFTPLADVRSMPKNTGKKIKLNHMMPLLDDRNVNDQGLDAAGATIADGNIYGSSKDIGNITAKLPALTEQGGRVNRVGNTRITLEGTFDEYGMFMEFSEDLLNFDSMADLYEHMSRELVSGAVQLTEMQLQMDLLAAAGVIRYSGVATQDNEITGEGTDISTISFVDLQRTSIALDDNRCPKSMKMIKGSQGFDTVTVDNGRLLYCGSEMIPTLTKMTDHFGNPAFVSVEQYGYAGTHKEGTGMIHGEIGKIGQFRIIVVPEMAHWAGVGAAETGANAGYRATDAKYDVFPLLCVGAESFTTIGFQTGGGKDFKFKIRTKMPKDNVTTLDPYGKTGFSSISYNYGFLPLRTERIALLKSVAEI